MPTTTKKGHPIRVPVKKFLCVQNLIFKRKTGDV